MNDGAASSNLSGDKSHFEEVVRPSENQCGRGLVAECLEFVRLLLELVFSIICRPYLPELEAIYCLSYKVLLMSCRSSPQVGDLRQQDNATPSLHPHYKGFITTTGSSAPRSGIGILSHGACHLSFPFTSETRFSRSIPKPVLRSCRLYTDYHRVRKQVSSRLIPE